MRTLGDNGIWSFYDHSPVAKKIKYPTEVRKADGHFVADYMDLATKIAEIQFRNPDFVLLFRGQSTDFRNKAKHTTLKPSMFRPDKGKKKVPDSGVIESRFDLLDNAALQLSVEFRKKGILGWEQIERYRILQWAILQHYEVCPTPLLDVTHSLRIAASFGSQKGGDEAFIFVLAVPNLSGAITANAESGLQIVRLSSVCPPSAVRPHIQEGYLLGEYPDIGSWGQKGLYANHEIDFGRRLIAKFRFNPKSFWHKDLFPQIDTQALYPSRSLDPFQELTELISVVTTPQTTK